MAKTLSMELEAQVGQRVTRPGWLVYLGFSAPLYMASFADTIFDGKVWSRGDVSVKALRPGQGGRMTATIEVGNKNNQLSAYILGEGINNREITIYQAYYDENNAFSGAKGVFKGLGNGADLSGQLSVLIYAASSSRANLFSPRFRICESNGFHHLLQQGVVLDWGKTSVIFED